MNSYKNVTYKYLKHQRNRTLLTILGIILSVAMISSIGTIIEGVRDAMIQNAIKNNGSYHISFSDLDKDQINSLKNHVEVDEIGISTKEGSARIAEITEEEKEMFEAKTSYRYIDVEGYDEKALNLLPFKISEGREPKNSKEIAIEKWMLSYFKEEVSLGDKIILSLGDRILNEAKEEIDYKLIDEKEYTLVGFIEPKFKWSGNLVTKGITGVDEEDLNKKQNVYFTLTNIKDANEKGKAIAEDLGIDSGAITPNERLLRLSAESRDEMLNESMTLILLFIVGLIVVSTIAVIYNSFNISVLERISQFGLLRSVGATPSQIRGIVLREAFILSIIAIPIGFLSGIGAMKIVFYIISKIEFGSDFFSDMEATISPLVFLISAVIGLITVFLSAIGPARKAGKISPLEAVRNTGSFKKETYKKVKRSSFVRKVLGVEGEIAYKNLRRNRKRFIITVFSMVISISLFITFSSFSDYMFKAGFIEQSTTGEFSVNMGYGENFDSIYSELKSIKDVKRVYKIRQNSGEVLLKEEKINKALIEYMPYILNEKKDSLNKIHNVNIKTIGDENFDLLKSVLEKGTVNIDELEKDNGVIVINNTYVYNQKTNKRKLIEGYSLKPGDKIQFSPYNFNEGDIDPVYKELKVMGVLERGILDEGYNLNGGINIITTEKNLEKILGEIEANNARMVIEMEEGFDKEPIITYLEEKESTLSNFSYYDYAKAAEQNKSANIIMSIFLYGFVTLITIISSINIINTISTNIILRTREISMIKAVGMTQRGIKRMVALESLFYGIYAALIGGVIGVGLSYTMFMLVINLSEFQWAIPWKNVAIACGGATIVALLSGILPLRRINEGIIVENMKADE